MKNATAPNRKTGRMIAKNLIILLVLAVIVFLTIWAWFTQGQKATADGINVKSRAEGVEVSWDNKDFYNDLTALTEDKVVKSQVGLAKNISGESPLKLVTGNGLSFFEPYLNRRIGKVLENSDGSWQGVEITNGAGKYIDIDLYFRGISAKDIYLAGDSYVSPKNTEDRISDYGDFSKDYICAASRVAFLNSNKTECSFIWAPNSNYELQEKENGYTRVKDVKEAEVSSGGSGSGLDGGAVEDGKDYYFWTIDTNKDYSNGEFREINKKYDFVYDSSIRYYVTEFTVIVPSYQANNPSIPFLISNSSSNPTSSVVSIDRSSSFNNNDSESLLKISNQDYNAATYNGQTVESANQFYITATQTLIQGTAVDIKFGFNPQTGVVTVLGYSGNDSWSKGGGGTVVKIKYYEIENNDNIALVSPEAEVAISTSDDITKAVNFKTSEKLNVLPVSITTNEQFTYEKTGETYETVYKFKSKKTNQYLTVSNGKVSFTDSGSDFSLSYIEGFIGPALKSGDYYIIMDNGTLKAVTSENLEADKLVTVYTGSSYTLDDSSSASQKYIYYDTTSKTTVELNGTTSPKLFATTSTTDATVKIGSTKVATLAKESDEDEYYKAHIVIRIWVEGTDRDAKTPLADGIFDTSLHFVSQ